MAIDSQNIPDITSGIVHRQWTTLRNKLVPVIPWLVIAGYGVIAAVLLIGTTIAVMSLAAVISGLAGVIVFLTVGLGIIVATPTAARWIIIRLVEATDLEEEHRRTISKISAFRDGVESVKQRQRQRQKKL